MPDYNRLVSPDIVTLQMHTSEFGLLMDGMERSPSPKVRSLWQQWKETRLKGQPTLTSAAARKECGQAP